MRKDNLLFRFRKNCLSIVFSLCALGQFGHIEAQIQPILPKTTTRAVVIGISKYENISPLRFAHKDAEAFAQFLRSPAGGNVPEAQIKLLTNEKATQAQIASALSWLMTESQSGDQAIIYFSGHGDVEAQITNLGYLLAYDANKATYMAGGALPVYALQSIVTNLSIGKQVQVLLIADACHSGNLAGNETGGTKTTALAMATQFANEVKIMSCSPNELSQESEEWGGGHGVFSYYLINGLSGLADEDEDRKVSLREIGRFLEDSVRRATVALRRQTPETYGSKDAVVAKVDPNTIAALKNKLNPPAIPAPATKQPADQPVSDTAVLRLYREFEDALRQGHLLQPEKGAAYAIYQQIKDHPAMRTYKNGMRNDLAAALQDEAQKAINDYLSADPREMRRRWSLDDSRYRLYPQYLEKAAELLGEGHFLYSQVKARAYYFTGLNLRLQGERPENAGMKDSLFRVAKKFQEQTLALDSTAAYAYNELGLLDRRFNQYEQSVVDFNRAVRFSPTWALPWANLCGSYTELDLLNDAERCGKKALDIDSTFALTHYNLGYVYLKTKEDNKAANHFQKVILYQSEYVNAYFNLGNSYFNLGNYVDAEQMWQSFNELKPNDPSVHNSLGEVYIKLNKFSEAESHFLKAINLDSTFTKPYLGLCELYLLNNQVGKSDEWFRKFSSLEPEHPEGYFILSLRNNKNGPTSLNYLEKALQKGYNDFNRIKTEPRLSEIRLRPEYKRLVKEYFPASN